MRALLAVILIGGISLLGLEAFCFLFPIRQNNRPDLNRVFNTTEFSTDIRTNSLGLREVEEISSVKARGEQRIFLIGDSFVFGYGVKGDEALSVQLQSLLKSSAPDDVKRVVNAGAPGTGPLHYLQFLRNLAIPLQSDVAILFVYLGDDLDNTVEPYLVFPYSLKNRLKFLFSHAYIWASAWRYNRRVPWESPPPPQREDDVSRDVDFDAWSDSKLYRWGKREGISPQELELRRSRLSAETTELIPKKLVNPALFYGALIHPQINNDISTLGSRDMKTAMKRCKAILQRAHNLCVRHGVTMAVVLIPAGWQVDEIQRDFWRLVGCDIDPVAALKTKPQEEFYAFCKDRGIPYLDLLPKLQSANIGPLTYRWDHHWRPSAVRYVAEILQEFLTREEIL